MVAIATSAVRDADNRGAFCGELRERFALDTRVLSGDDEARLTYLGAIQRRAKADDVLVVDIGGGSTELVIGSGSGSRRSTRPSMPGPCGTPSGTSP